MNNPNRKDFYMIKKSAPARYKVVISIISIALVFFFGLQFFSQLFSGMAQNKSNPAAADPAATPGKIKFLAWSSLLSPLEAAPQLEYGFALLAGSVRSQDPGMLAKSIHYLKKAIADNMLYYNGHFYLGKAYLEQNVRDHSSFDAAVESFKRAAMIRGNDTRVSMDTMTILLSLAPFLEEKDKKFCIDLLKKTITRINKDDFNSLLDDWALYCKDLNFFKDVLDKMPPYYLLAAQKLGQIEMAADARYEFLAKYTVYYIAELRDLYQQYLAEKPADLLPKLKAIFDNLEKRVFPYYLEKSGNTAGQKSYDEFKRTVNLEILGLLFAREGWQKDARLKTELETYILSYIKDLMATEALKSFHDFLAKKEFFNLPDLRAFYIKQTIAFQSGEFESVIMDTEEFKRSISFVKKEFEKDYYDILLLLTDAYISSRLLTRAYAVLKEIDTRVVDAADFYWRKMIIEKVLGPEMEKDGQQQNAQQQYEIIAGSRIIALDSARLTKTVYITSDKEIEIRFADALYEKIRGAHILGVFIDGKLVYEEYLSGLVFPVKVTVPTEKTHSRHTLDIKIE
ncbi:MAG: hypothetical protein L0Y73_06450 [Candidatus Aminicenantes bacterium]|nr:hypothetical protein [Candidatus Aminicenantes bacterium]